LQDEKEVTAEEREEGAKHEEEQHRLNESLQTHHRSGGSDDATPQALPTADYQHRAARFWTWLRRHLPPPSQNDAPEALFVPRGCLVDIYTHLNNEMQGCFYAVVAAACGQGQYEMRWFMASVAATWSDWFPGQCEEILDEAMPITSEHIVYASIVLEGLYSNGIVLATRSPLSNCVWSFMVHILLGIFGEILQHSLIVTHGKRRYIHRVCFRFFVDVAPS